MKKPEPFYIGRPKPNSTKWEVAKEFPKDGYKVTMDENYRAILFNGVPVIYVTKDFGTEWTFSWNWTMIASRAGKKLSTMIKYLKSLD